MKKYTVIAMRTLFGARCNCPDHKADSFDVWSPDNGHWIASCKRREDAEAVANGLWAVDLLAERAQEAERCRQAACAALGTDHETLAAAIAALIEGRDEAIKRILGAQCVAVAA